MVRTDAAMGNTRQDAQKGRSARPQRAKRRGVRFGTLSSERSETKRRTFSILQDRIQEVANAVVSSDDAFLIEEVIDHFDAITHWIWAFSDMGGRHRPACRDSRSSSDGIPSGHAFPALSVTCHGRLCFSDSWISNSYAETHHPSDLRRIGSIAHGNRAPVRK